MPICQSDQMALAAVSLCTADRGLARPGLAITGCVGSEGWIDDVLPCRTCADLHLRQGVAPMPPELARTTWRWVSLTTPEETLTIAEPER
jgi:hypothetical protein